MPSRRPLIIGVIVLCAIFLAGGIAYLIAEMLITKKPVEGPRTGLPPPVSSTSYASLEFVNTMGVDVYVIPKNGTAIDNNGWTAWPTAPQQADPNLVSSPVDPSVVYTFVPNGGSVWMKVLLNGQASMAFQVRSNCDPATQICAQGDSTYVPGLDGPTPGALRAGVPYKPAIDTLFECTSPCLYTNQALCGVNPSCITNPGSCTGFPQFMAAQPTGSKFRTDGRLYTASGAPGPQLPASAILPAFYYDISCVDGFTIPLTLQVKRPSTAVPPVVGCGLNSGAASGLDVPSNLGWQTVASTMSLDLHNCPQGEILWPAPQALKGVTGQGDGYSDPTIPIGTLQYPMPFVTQATPGYPGGTTLLPAFSQGVPIPTTVYRDPSEVAKFPSKFQETDIIGCASPCALLTQDRSVTALYTKPGGYTDGLNYTVPSKFLQVTNATTGTPNALPSTLRGVNQVCCVTDGLAVATDSNLLCNTSKWMIGNGTSLPASPAAVADYGFGFYSQDYTPGPGDPKWAPSLGGNPYLVGNGTDAYVSFIRGGWNPITDPLNSNHRAYSYQHDDTYVTVVCSARDATAPCQDSSGNPIPCVDSQGNQFLSPYLMRIVIGFTLPP